MDDNRKRSKVFYGWYIAGACLLITLYAGGVVHFGFTAVFEPIADDFGWSYATVSLASSLRGLEMGLLAPLTGFLVDRWGPRRLIFTGSLLICTGFLLLSRTSSLATFYLAFAFLASGMSTCSGTVLMTAVTNWFRKKAGLVVGIVASGFGLGGLLVPVVTLLIDKYEWRMAMAIVGLGTLATVLPLSLMVRHKPEQYGYQPDGETGNAAEAKEGQVIASTVEVSIPASIAFRTRTFWHIAVSSMCHAFVVGAIVTHMMPYLSSLGISRSFSSLIALMLPVASIVGRLSSGWLSERFDSRRILATGFSFMTAGLLFFAYVTTGRMWLLVPFIIVFSLGWGINVTIRMAVQREHFGRGSFGTILGFLTGFMMFGNVTGAPLAGWIYDNWGSYQGAWLSFGILTLVGAVLAFTIPAAESDTGETGRVGIQQVIT
jgi:sugar phosphate permease